MSDSVSNENIYNCLMEIKGDIGGLTAKQDLFLKGLENHSTRIVALEGATERQRGAVKVWGMVATGAAALIGTVPSILRALKH